ncbi:MAG: flavin reductase family protein [Saprospiraceae bacterium]
MNKYKSLSSRELVSMDKNVRIRMLNMLSGLRTAYLIGTCDIDKTSNLGLFNSVVHIGASPALLGFIMRPVHVRRDTYCNILETESFTLNAIHPDFLERAHKASSKYDATVSEFDMVGLTEEWRQDTPSPFVLESRLKIGLGLQEILDIQSNDTKLIIGRIEHIFIEGENIIDADGHIRHEELDLMVVSGLEQYYSILPLERFRYKN